MVVLHGEQGVAVLAPKGESVKQVIPMQFPGQESISSTRTLDECR